MGELTGVHHDGEVRREGAHQPRVGVGDPRLPPPGADAQRAQNPPAVPQGDLESTVAGITDGCQLGAGPVPDDGGGGTDSGGDGLQHGRHGVVGRDLEAGGDAVDGDERIALPQHEAVHQGAQPAGHRDHEDRDHRRRHQQRQRTLRCEPRQGRGQPSDGQGDDHRERDVEQATAEHDLDAQQPVAEHPDDDSDRDERVRQPEDVLHRQEDRRDHGSDD